MYDLIIRNGTIVDGSGAQPVTADIAISAGIIAKIGDLNDAALEEIDAKGHVVTPGFVDLHTHLDAQIGWDPSLTPISWHGVTTALMGNCGVTFAPCKPEDKDLLAAMMETVEDIPREAIREGLPWSWEDYGGYLDAIEEMNPAINVAGLVGHCAVRYYVMGDRSITEQPTEDEQAQIVKIVGDSIRAGAAGFSTNRFLGHYMPDGRHVPGTHALHEEVEAIAAEVGAAGGLMQNVLNLGGNFEGEAELLRKEAKAANGRILFSITAGAKDSSGQRVKNLLEELNADGLDVSAISVPRGTGFITGLQCGFPWKSDAWHQLADMDLAARLVAINDITFCEKLVTEASEKPGLPPEELFWMGTESQPDYLGSTSLSAMAEEAGEHPAQTYLRLARETDGLGLFTMQFFNKNLKALANLFSSDHCLPGLGDAGAHVGQVMDSGWSTFVLTHWHKRAQLFSLPEAIHKLTAAPARILGLSDRGLLQEGMRADINVIDMDRLGEKMPRIVHDFPFESPRFIQQGQGYMATICNGTVILRDDELTGDRGGEVIRHYG
ncbi:MAG: amidohydrolase family protein [Gammaproteobacteria bacterium]|jgi:N-acyl-D-aspartate/D-glutamate deacylase|nr:amidohydrolase family protein [Gammaproteobacteria bacterium]MBT5724987.1 amidohydrolase family protein [Gammaproteobacteria bacterium]MBT6584520.1 amidohydrolase family protein [Gammaproteobacteria bacterium]MBT6889981.1 amidohydrolase family protein [Gammaproteobacteria bacterium]MBT7877371.1 amidohydrolase family protein [Gammaproteobacteria bacterium]